MLVDYTLRDNYAHTKRECKPCKRRLKHLISQNHTFVIVMIASFT